MHVHMVRLGSVLAALALTTLPAAAIESQALGIVKPLPAQIVQVFSCGRWTKSGSAGYYRIVLAEVSHGTGTEVYVQRIREADPGSAAGPKMLETTPLHELNNDHAQYQVSSARCIGAGARSSVELLATFEHDESNVEHRIRISLATPNSYRISDTVFRPTRKQ